MKMLFEEVKQRITKHEGVGLKPYKDTVGKLTIGIGRNLDDKGISITEANLMLENDIKDAERDIKNSFSFFDDLSPIRQYILLDMCFNIGIMGLKGFKKMIAALTVKDYLTASKEMLNSKWAVQVGPRATELSNLMIEG